MFFSSRQIYNHKIVISIAIEAMMYSIYLVKNVDLYLVTGTAERGGAEIGTVAGIGASSRVLLLLLLLLLLFMLLWFMLLFSMVPPF